MIIIIMSIQQNELDASVTMARRCIDAHLAPSQVSIALRPSGETLFARGGTALLLILGGRSYNLSQLLTGERPSGFLVFRGRDANSGSSLGRARRERACGWNSMRFPRRSSTDRAAIGSFRSSLHSHTSKVFTTIADVTDGPSGWDRRHQPAAEL